MQYDDIINLEHHVSTTHPHMDELSRAAQFAPFAALTGYEEVIAQTQRAAESSMDMNGSFCENDTFEP
jgi:hypothetical protein